MFLAILARFISSRVSCMNPMNKEIDWFAMFKVPTLSDRIPTHVEGTGFFYQDDIIPFSEATSDVNSSKANPLFNTFDKIYTNSDLSYIFISDQPPDTDSSKGAPTAHMKAIYMVDDDNAVYMEHSVPRYPPYPRKSQHISYPETGTKYGQSFVCITLTHEEMEKLAGIHTRAKPFTYDSRINSQHQKFGNLSKIANNNEDNSIPYEIAKFTVGKKKVTAFSKGASFAKDIYFDLIAKELNTTLEVEGWRSGSGGNMVSDCDGDYKVFDILNLNMRGVLWKVTNDHSKWGIGARHACIGGVNRQNSQTKRGGSTICIEFPPLARSLTSSIDSFYECPEKTT